MSGSPRFKPGKWIVMNTKLASPKPVVRVVDVTSASNPTCFVLVQRVLGNVRVPCLLQLFCGGKTCGVNRVGSHQARRAEARGLRQMHFSSRVKGIGGRSRSICKVEANLDRIHKPRRRFMASWGSRIRQPSCLWP